MQELFMIANFIDLDSKNFSTVVFYVVDSSSPVLPFEVISTICLYAAQEETAESGTRKRTWVSWSTDPCPLLSEGRPFFIKTNVPPP